MVYDFALVLIGICSINSTVALFWHILEQVESYLYKSVNRTGVLCSFTVYLYHNMCM